MAKLVMQGHYVYSMALSICGNAALMTEFEDACDALGVVDRSIHNFTVREFYQQRENVAKLFYDIRNDFDYVFTNSTDCKHPDHRVVAEESKRIFGGNIITYLQAWNGNEDSNYFVSLSEDHLKKKLQALECYKSQRERRYFNPGFIVAQADFNGIKCGKLYAEAFKIERLIQ